MAKGAITVKIDGQYDNKDISRAIRDLEALKTKSANAGKEIGSFASIAKGVGATLLATFSVAAVTDFFKDTATAAMQDQLSLVKLATAMKNVGLAAQQPAVEEFIASLSKAVGVADDELRPAFARLLRSTNDVTQSQRALQIALDVSSATGKDLDTVANALGKAYDGNAASLGRLGLGLDKALLKSGDMVKITGTLEEKFGGQAAAAADTYAGKMKRISVATDEAKEKIGYALLDALDRLGNRLGGTDGTISLIDNLSTQTAGLVTGLGLAADEFLRLAQNAAGADAATGTDWGNNVLALGYVASAALPSLLPLVQGVDGLVETGNAYNESAARTAEAMKQQTAHAMAEGRAVSYAAQQAAGLTTANDAAAASTEALKQVFSDFTQALSNQAAIDNYKTSLRNIQDELAKSSRSLDINTDAGEKNRKAIINVFNDGAAAVQAWADRTGADAAQVEARMATMTGNIRRKLIDEGFKASDVDKFLGGIGIWDASTKALIQHAAEAARREAKIAAVAKFMGIGRDLAAGLVDGLNSGQTYVDAGVRAMMRRAEEAARRESQTHSPSKKWQAIGEDLLAGLSLGLTEQAPRVIRNVETLMRDVYAAAAKSKVDSSAISDMRSVGSWIIEQISAGMSNAQSALDSATSQMHDFAASIRGALIDEFGKGLEDAYKGALDDSGQFAADKWIGGVDQVFAQWDWYNNVLREVKNQGGSQALIEYLVQQGAAAGGAQGQAMIDKGLIPKFNDMLGEVEMLARQTGNMMAEQYYGPGVDSAQRNYEGMRDALKPGGPVFKAIMDLMDNLAAAMARDVPIDVWITRHVKTIEKAVKMVNGVETDVAGATGGIVTRPTISLIGEAGPEAVIPLSSTPGSSPLSGMGSTYNITVQAGVGDPASIGRTVVESIRAYERRSGKVFAAA